MTLIESLIKEGWLKTPGIVEAFKTIKRVDFLPPELKNLAELNEALPIGYGQTISQPLVVAFMLEKLSPKKGDRILDIGSGSGWTSALLAQIVGKKGKIFSLEIIPELKKRGEKNVAKYNFIRKGIVEYICADGHNGYKKGAPFDKILISAEVRTFSKAWEKQLKPKGRIVLPIHNSIWLLVKKSEGGFKKKEYPGFVFVPLVKK